MDGVPARISWMFWVAFNVFIVGMLVVDMMVGTRRGGVATALRWRYGQAVRWGGMSKGYLASASTGAVVLVTPSCDVAGYW